MKKLIFATLGLIALLLVSIVARNANFNLKAMMQTGFIPLPSASSSAQPNLVTPPAYPVEIYITVTPFGYVPSALMIKEGTKITWINKSGGDATVSPDSKLPSFPTDTLGNNSTESFTFSANGRYTYHNQKSPSQTGVIIVE